MPQPTMVSTDDDLRVGRVATPVWQAAVEHLADGSAAGAPEEMQLQWRSAGIIDADLEVAPDWRVAIEAQARSARALTVVARMGEVAFLTNAFVHPTDDRAVCVTVRSTVTRDGEIDRIDVVHPQAEVATAPLAGLWPLLRRVLPPLDEFRSDATDTAETVPLEHSDEALAAADGAEASVFAHALTSDGAAGDEVVWYLLDAQLHRLEPRQGRLQQVGAGDVARVLPTLLGA